MPHSLPEKDFQDEKILRAPASSVRDQEILLNAFGLPLIIVSTEGKVKGFNGAAEKLFGYRADEVIGKSAIAAFHNPGDFTQEPGAPESDPALPYRAGQGPSEWKFLRKDGTPFIGSLSVVPLQDETGRVAEFACLITDLSAAKSLKEIAASSEKKFNLLAAHIPGTIYLCNNDEQYSVIYLNEHIRELTGYPASEFLNGSRSIVSLFHPDDRKYIYDTINSSIAARKSFHLQYRLRHASGEWRWVEEHGVGVFENDRFVMLEGFMQDMTTKKEAEEKLKTIARENLRFFNNPVNLNATADFNGELQRISPSWTSMLGWTEEELRARPILEFVHPADVEQTTHVLGLISKSRKVHTFETRMKTKGGDYRWLLWGAASDPASRMIYASAIDISERKASEETILDSKSNLESITLQLQEQNRRLDEFAHIISHNLRAPFNNIQALINLLDDKSEISDYKLIFEKLKNVAKNLSETMNELMDTLKAKTQHHVDRAEIRFKEVLDKVVQSLEGELIVAQASVTFDFNEAPVVVFSKPYLESIFQNLLTNSIKYRSPHRKPVIHFKSSLAGKQVELHVSDNGQGIDMEKFGDKLFGLHKTFHEHQEARGVGLFLVKTQVEALGGTISVSSEVDKGTIFTIRF